MYIQKSLTLAYTTHALNFFNSYSFFQYTTAQFYCTFSTSKETLVWQIKICLILFIYLFYFILFFC